MDKALTFSSRQDWRAWLNSNHNKATSVWMVFYKKGSGKQTLTLQDTVEEAICFGWIDSKLRKCNDKTYILRFSPRKPNSVWSKINKERAEQLIATGQMSPAGLATVKEAKKNGAWDRAYTNITLDAVPTDLKEALLKEPAAWDNFNRFANSYRNMYVGWVSQAKTAGTREKRIKAVVEQSLKNKKVMFQ